MPKRDGHIIPLYCCWNWRWCSHGREQCSLTGIHTWWNHPMLPPVISLLWGTVNVLDPFLKRDTQKQKWKHRFTYQNLHLRVGASQWEELMAPKNPGARAYVWFLKGERSSLKWCGKLLQLGMNLLLTGGGIFVTTWTFGGTWHGVQSPPGDQSPPYEWDYN